MAGQREISPFDAWREAVRPWLSAGLAAHQLVWGDLPSRVTVRVAGVAPACAAPPPVNDTLRLPRSLMTLLQTLACFRHGSRWEFMYRLAWRMLFESSQLLTDPAEP